MRAVILVPRRAGIADRDRLWAFARQWWENDHPDIPIYEGHHNTGPFNRSAAINAAAREAGDWDVAVIIDSDVLCDANTVRTAIDVAGSTDAITLAGDQRVMLSKVGTTKILDGYRGNWLVKGMYERIYTDHCSCCVVVSRKLWDSVGGFDELCVGYGWEDVCFRIACETISGKNMVTLSQQIWHLFHLPSHENNHRSETFKANERRADRYKAAYRNPEAIRTLLEEAAGCEAVEPVDLGPTRIPRIMFRTVVEAINEQHENWWLHQQQLHPGWEFISYREPLDPADWPLIGDLMDKCQNGAQKAGLVRLSGLITHGGVFVDADVMPVRSFEPLLHSPAFAGWEDSAVVPDAIMAAEPNHPAFVQALEKARAVIQGGGDAWHSGPGVMTELLPGRNDVLLLAPGHLYPHHYLQRSGATSNDGPWIIARHMWDGSWLNPSQRRSIEQRQRP